MSSGAEESETVHWDEYAADWLIVKQEIGRNKSLAFKSRESRTPRQAGGSSPASWSTSGAPWGSIACTDASIWWRLWCHPEPGSCLSRRCCSKTASTPCTAQSGFSHSPPLPRRGPRSTTCWQCQKQCLGWGCPSPRCSSPVRWLTLSLPRSSSRSAGSRRIPPRHILTRSKEIAAGCPSCRTCWQCSRHGLQAEKRHINFYDAITRCLRWQVNFLGENLLYRRKLKKWAHHTKGIQVMI